MKTISALFIFLLMIGSVSCERSNPENLDEQTFALLTELRDERADLIRRHFASVNSTARQITSDSLMLGYFRQLRATSEMELQSRKLSALISHEIDVHFINRYGNFFDILFVDRGGLIFHSIRQEADYGTNLLHGHLADTQLARVIQERPKEDFVDFLEYDPSGEPAAFFIKPIMSGEDITGWFILQYASNALNSLLTHRDRLGKTGEIYLVNKDRKLLSDSHFFNNSGVLKVIADHDAVETAFSDGAGQMITNDYRGVRVYSSFNTIDCFNTTWAILAEIDESEIVSRHYRRNATDLLPTLCDLAAKTLEMIADRPVPTADTENMLRVDVGEMRRVDNDGNLFTAGIGPCTAIIAHMPGRFGYMVHLSPTDDVYYESHISQIFLGDARTCFMNDLMRRIKEYDIRLCELRDIHFTVVATHTNSIGSILEHLLESEIDLSQISFMYNPHADYADVMFHQASGLVEAKWVTHKDSKVHWSTQKDRRYNLVTLLKQIIDSNKDS